MPEPKNLVLPQHFACSMHVRSIVKLESGAYYCLARRPDGKWYYSRGRTVTRPLPIQDQAYLNMMAEDYEAHIKRLEKALRAAGVDPATLPAA